MKTIFDYIYDKEQNKSHTKKPRIEKGVTIICKGHEKVILSKSHPFLKEKLFKNIMKLMLKDEDNTLSINDMTKEELDIICICYDIKHSDLDGIFFNTIMNKIINEKNDITSSNNRDKLHKLYIVCDKYCIEFVRKPLINAWMTVVRHKAIF